MEFDILDMCILFQTVGFKIKDIYKESTLFEEKSDSFLKYFLKQSSGINVVLESNFVQCNCPQMEENDDNGKWDVSGTSGGIQITRTVFQFISIIKSRFKSIQT
jgi:hypothetical protein